MNLPEVLRNVGAVIEGDHVVYTSGKHGRAYVNWVSVLRNSEAAMITARVMVELVGDLSFTTIVGPTHTGDKVAAFLAAALLEKGRTTQVVYAQEETIQNQILSWKAGTEVRVDLEVVTDRRKFPRGQEEDVRGQRVLLVDDVFTTGTTLSATIEAIHSSGGTVECILVGCNRSAHRETFLSHPVRQLISVNMEQWDQADCEACKENLTINTAVGHGAEFIQEFGMDPANWPANLAA